MSGTQLKDAVHAGLTIYHGTLELSRRDLVLEQYVDFSKGAADSFRESCPAIVYEQQVDSHENVP